MSDVVRATGMSKRDVALLLAVIAAYDQRTVGAADVEAWHAVAKQAGWNTEGARRAVVAHYAAKTTRLMPAHITTFLSPPGGSPEEGFWET